MKTLDDIDAYKLDWNPITVEAFDKKKNEAILVFNLDITTETKTQNVIQYVAGRTFWACRHLPPRSSIWLRFDVRGQGISTSRTTFLQNSIMALLNKFRTDNHILIDFLR